MKAPPHAGYVNSFVRAGFVTATVLVLLGAVSVARLSWTAHVGGHHPPPFGPHPTHGVGNPSAWITATPHWEDNLASHKTYEHAVPRPKMVWMPIPYGGETPGRDGWLRQTPLWF